MKVKILKGTNQIGGCITEITSNKGTKIIIDFGEDLVEEKQPVDIMGLTKGDSIYDAVFITHSHGDHIGLVGNINKDIPVYMEAYAKKIYHISSDFMKDAKPITRKTKNIVFGKTETIADIKVTPYMVDHSAYHSCMYVIEADGKRVLHTGDYRNHGRKGKNFIETLKQIGPIDLLITEGTIFGRSNEKFKTEDEILKELYPIFEQYHQVFVLQSSTNIDRLVTFYKASNHTKKYFVEDVFTATIASNLKKTIPNPITHKNVSVWITNKYYRKPKQFQETYLVLMEQYKRNKPFHHDFCMIVKPSMLEDIKEKLYQKGLLNNACLIYSMWDGYLEEESIKTFKKDMEERGIAFFKCHTSGHADKNAMMQVEKILKPEKTIFIHTEHKEMGKEIFKTVIDINDNEEVIV